MAINAPIQGTQADIIKLAMVRVDRMLEEMQAKEDVHLLLQVHDELVYEVKDARVGEMAKKIQDVMEGALSLEEARGVPIRADVKVGPNWGTMEAL